MIDLSRKYAILGLARSGIAAAMKLRDLGVMPFISDLSTQPLSAEQMEALKGFEYELGRHSDKLFEYDTWIISPGIPLNVPIITEGKKRGIKMISEIEFGYRIKAEDSKIIAVTGSNGKSTTVSLIHHILSKLGKKCILAGNIGAAFSHFAIEKPGIEYIILEVSSFQLDLISTFKPDVAVLLNITPDHLNRYAGFDEYAVSKTGIFRHQSDKDVAIINKDCPAIQEHLGKPKSKLLQFSVQDMGADAFLDGKCAVIHGKRYALDELLIKGPHNHQNLMAAMLVIDSLGLDLDLTYDAAKSFSSLPHRLEYVESIAGVSFYNDSKATNTDSVRCALMSFERPIRLILGGSDKGEDFSLLTDDLKKHAAKLYLTGDTAEKMRAVWEGILPLRVESDFGSAIRAAFEEAEMGESVVLSPACASFDNFKNFEERGERFKTIVREIKHEKEKL